jgi:hypothetical protein
VLVGTHKSEGLAITCFCDEIASSDSLIWRHIECGERAGTREAAGLNLMTAAGEGAVSATKPSRH